MNFPDTGSKNIIWKVDYRTLQHSLGEEKNQSEMILLSVSLSLSILSSFSPIFSFHLSLFSLLILHFTISPCPFYLKLSIRIILEIICMIWNCSEPRVGSDSWVSQHLYFQEALIGIAKSWSVIVPVTNFIFLASCNFQHYWFQRSHLLFLTVSLPFSLCLSLSLSLSLSIYLFLYLTFYSISIFIYLSFYPPIYPPIYQPIYLFNYLSIYISNFNSLPLLISFPFSFHPFNCLSLIISPYFNFHYFSSVSVHIFNLIEKQSQRTCSPVPLCRPYLRDGVEKFPLLNSTITVLRIWKVWVRSSSITRTVHNSFFKKNFVRIFVEISFVILFLL